MQAGHDEVEREENLGVLLVNGNVRVPGNVSREMEGRTWDVVLDELVVVFDALNSKEDEAEQHGQDQANDDGLLLAELRGADRERDGQTGADQHGGVGSTQHDAEALATGAEVPEVPVAVNQGGAEHAPEKNDFVGEEHPNAEAGRVFLLLLGSEMMQEGRVLMGLLVGCRDRAIVQPGPPL